MILADDLNWIEKNDCYRFLVVFSITFSDKIFYNLKTLLDVMQHLSWCKVLDPSKICLIFSFIIRPATITLYFEEPDSSSHIYGPFSSEVSFIKGNRIINTNKCWNFSKTSHELLSEIKQISILWKKIFFSLLMLLSHFNLWSCWFMWIYCINMYQFNYLVEATISSFHLFQGP